MMKQENRYRREALRVAGLTFLAMLLWAAAYQFKQPLTLDVGGNYDAPYLTNYYQAESNAGENYRWANPYSYLYLPGVGVGKATVELQMAAGGAKQLPLLVQSYVNGAPTEQLSLAADSSTQRVNVPFYPLFWGGDQASGGDLKLVLQAAGHGQPGYNKPVAFQVSHATLLWGDGLIIPSAQQLVLLAGGLVVLYLLLRRVGVGWRMATVSVASYALICAILFASNRLFLTVYSQRLLTILIITYLAVWPAQWLASYLFKLAKVEASQRLMLVITGMFAVGLALKLGGLYHPLSHIVDAEFHLARLREVSRDFWRYYQPPGLALAVMPKGDWKTQGIIPYSPFFYMASVTLTWLPCLLELKVYLVSALLDALRVFPVAFIALRFGWGERATGYAATLAAFTPATYLLQQWGNWPTNYSLTFTLIFVAVLVGCWPRLTWRAMLWLTGLLTLTFLSYTVTAVFLGLTLVGLLGLGLGRELLGRLLVRRVASYGLVASQTNATTTSASPPEPTSFSDMSAYMRLLLVLVLATTLSLLLFYGQYVAVILRDTLPSFADTAAEGGSLKPNSLSWSDYLAVSAQTVVRYSLWPIYLLGIVGLVSIVRTERGRLAYFSKALLISFLGMGLLAVVLDHYADMAMKQYWWALPFMALAGGWLLGRFSRWADGVEDERSRLLLYFLPNILTASFVLNSLLLWVDRLFFHNR